VSLPCCNEIEHEDYTATRCTGTMVAGWPEYVCDTCQGRCGAQVHPQHAPRMIYPGGSPEGSVTS
jgi:hypothetical protein